MERHETSRRRRQRRASAAAGRRNEAAVTLGQALKRYARKNLAQAGQVRKRLAEFQDAASR
jgi:hypothetical protein